MGQKRAVTVHTFICRQSIETWQLKMLLRKRRLAKAVLPDSAALDRPSEAEIKELFEMAG